MQRGLLSWVALAVLCTGCGDTAGDARVQTALREALAARTRAPYVTAGAEGTRLWKLTQQFYENREYQPAWIDGTKPRPQLRDLLEALEAAAEEGLDPQLYNLTLLGARHGEANAGFLTKKGFDATEAGTLDVWLTYVYLTYASDLAQGLSDLARADRSWQIRPQKFDPAAHLADALDADRVEASLRALVPDDPQYRALRQALADHRSQAAQGGWDALPAKARLKPGEKSRVAATLARRLAASGDYRKRAPAEDATVTFDEALQEAVTRFQRRHGLADDGVVGPGTVAALNVPIQDRIRQIELNLERSRWLPRERGDRHILVNIPEYRLELWDGGRVPLAMPVVVGKADTPTPIFDGEMTYLVFSPYWHVPPGIAEGETLPAVMKDPAFLAQNDMEVLDSSGGVIDPSAIDLADPSGYRFRQRPGARNSLGLVKFMFPNQHHVYLHDTPADSLFARASRSFSHGCVRVAEPQRLAEYLLRDQREWTSERIAEAMHAGEERTVRLREGVPVYLAYWTARVSADGELQFRPDVYGIDRRQRALLDDRLARLRKTAAAAAQAAEAAPTPPRSNE